MEAAETEGKQATARRVPRVRSPEFDFRSVPRHWLAGSALTTQMANSVNLLFPTGERFFVRSVRHYLDALEDPVLREQVRAFFGQEGRHARAHELFFDALRAQGYEIDGFLRVYDRIAWKTLEPRMTPALRLAITAALEHYTAILAEGALRERVFDQVADRTMQDLLKWHAAEEIEHRAVAFDVLRQVAPGYGTRAAGMLVATVGLAAFWLASMVLLLRQDRARGWRLDAHEVNVWKRRPRSIVGGVFVRGMLQYFRPGFHPADNAMDGLAEGYLAEAGMAPAERSAV
jgi:predicted metal-dependent hydrolase